MSRLLTRGMTGSDVGDVQRALNRAGGSSLPRLAEDNIFGPKTHARVLEFQRSRGLKADGIVGPKTRAALGVPEGPSPKPAPGPRGQDAVTAVVTATKDAFGTWKRTATLVGVIINGAVAVGGTLLGPPLDPLISAHPEVMLLKGTARTLALAAARGIGLQFLTWQATVKVPGLPWYPAFAVVPAPVAPPAPNVPAPLVAISPASATFLSAVRLKSSMMAAVAGQVDQATAEQTMGGIAQQLEAFFITAMAITMVTNVMGTGPVPTFAPPMVPVGPVVGGVGTQTPGGMT